MTQKSTKFFVASALSMALVGTVGAQKAEASKEKCYGISKAGQNHCAHADGRYSCAGNATEDFDGGDWKYVAKGTCVDQHKGSLTPFDGQNPKKK